MKMLIIHQFFWAHYKAKIYTELQKVVDKNPNDELLVLQTALNEFTRSKIGSIDYSIHQYNVQILFEDFYENTTVWQRVKKSLFWVNKFKPDVINLPGYYEPAMNIVLFYCKLKGIKIVISSDSTESDNPNVWWRESLKRFVVSQAQGFFCYGTKSAEYILKLGMKPEHILVENNSVDNVRIEKVHTEALQTRQEVKKSYQLKKYNFVYVGRLIEIKNLDNLLAAYKPLANSDWGLIILGDGSEEEKLKKYASDNQLEGVKFIAGQPWYDVPKILALADVFVLPSYSEPWGLVVNEAMACGLPVIVSNKCGSAFDVVIENQNGYTFNPHSVEELTNIFEKFVENPDKIKIFGEKSKEIIKRFSPENVAQEMYDGFKKVVYDNK
ncbi:glycosyl transferase group 1 [Emticicia oligotrophica DSM 17448]|uniref:Glycosyl transferase group 1 n=1 Tax=Emticicia oligotrophica (strain DSM 17448 / CIP 109782 / MTCC 6937 / GPTSA100-15) TaxID=929562 RepID=A0ABN4ATN7_EMTOG|nr:MULTISPECIES: glycosyltransferase family 4 protein [Emticicia]AFK05052.1 glycosyl transferase group 1 [Emticicia oligotrophica DSM 17448]